MNDVKIWQSTANILFTLLYGLTRWSKATKRRLMLETFLQMQATRLKIVKYSSS
jgi:hypothetical protein